MSESSWNTSEFEGLMSVQEVLALFLFSFPFQQKSVIWPRVTWHCRVGERGTAFSFLLPLPLRAQGEALGCAACMAHWAELDPKSSPAWVLTCAYSPAQGHFLLVLVSFGEDVTHAP